MASLVVADHDNKELKPSTLAAVTAAKALGSEVHVLVVGTGCKTVADAAAKIEGVVKVRLADAAQYQHQLAEPMAALVAKLALDYGAVLAVANANGKNWLPRVAAALDVSQISDVIKVESPDTF